MQPLSDMSNQAWSTIAGERLAQNPLHVRRQPGKEMDALINSNVNVVVSLSVVPSPSRDPVG